MHTHPSRPTVRWRPAHITVCESTYCRLSSTKSISDSWYPQAGLGSRHDGIRSSPSCKTFQGSVVKSVESASTIPIRMRVFTIEAYLGWRQLLLNRKFVDGKYLNSFLYDASPYLSYIYIITYFFIKIKFIS